MDSTVKEMATVLRSTETMAAQFALHVQERMGEPVSNDEILAAMKSISVKQLSMQKVIARVRQQKSKRRT